MALYVATLRCKSLKYPTHRKPTHPSQINYQGDYSTLDAPHNALESDSNDRKNLYVLNIPLDMTSDEFRDLFIPFGTVTHAVILASVVFLAVIYPLTLLSLVCLIPRLADAVSCKFLILKHTLKHPNTTCSDMSTPQEAAEALNTLNGANIRCVGCLH